jgi:hypothetical protein
VCSARLEGVGRERANAQDLVDLYATIDAASLKAYLPDVPLLLPLASWCCLRAHRKRCACDGISQLLQLGQQQPRRFADFAREVRAAFIG